jgi:hypothetical protein
LFFSTSADKWFFPTRDISPSTDPHSQVRARFAIEKTLALKKIKDMRPAFAP